MAYVKIENGVVVQKQPNAAQGFIESPDSVVCGMLYANGEYSAPVVSAVLPDLTPRQIRLALNQLGLRTTVEAIVAGADQDTHDWWQYSQTYERNHPMIVAMLPIIGVTSEQADAVWELGASL